MNKKYTIAVAGTGYVGLSIATLLSQHHKVWAVDIIPEKVEMINNRRSPIADKEIEEYLATKELDLTAFIRHAYQCGLRVVFPCMNRTEVRSERMDMRQVTREAFECGRAPFVSSPAEAFERNEPLLSVFPVVHPQDVDMVVVPLVAYDRRNKRLGYGAGNYDGFLAGIRPDAVVVGAAFTEQLVDEVPCEPHDVPLPHIATA